MISAEKYALITGARTGIGKAMAEYCAGKGMNLLLVSSPGKDLDEVTKSIAVKYHIKTCSFETDLSNPGSPEKILQWVKMNDFRVNILVNNAGKGGTVLFERTDVAYNDERILLNIRAVVALTTLFLPLLRLNEESYILNVSSLAAFSPMPYKAVYSSSKAFILYFSKALRYELRGSPVNISVLCPNGVKTNSEISQRLASHGMLGKIFSLSVDQVAKTAIDKMLAKKFIIIPGRMNRVLLWVNKILPSSIRQKILAGEFRKELG